MVRRRKRKRIAGIERELKASTTAANQSWSMDFVSVGMVDGRRIRCLNIVDDRSGPGCLDSISAGLSGSLQV
jgi:putative transposase